jgi:hypothetical protein
MPNGHPVKRLSCYISFLLLLSLATPAFAQQTNKQPELVPTLPQFITPEQITKAVFEGLFNPALRPLWALAVVIFDGWSSVDLHNSSSEAT